ncbi:MAG: thioredoxin family protein [Bacilli bacterium]|nr:thioredoxin family protein [Bacilli bacterium]MDD4547628.1 thioredoxin family protein [Bacilli bacterium]
MKNKKNNTLFWLIGGSTLIVGFFILLAIVNKEMPVEQVMTEAFSATESKLVYLSRPDCSWCQKAKPILNKASKKYGFEYLYINTGKLNSEKLESILEEFEIDINSFGTPTFVIVKNGEIVDSNIGYMQEDAFLDFLRSAEVIR